MVLEPSELPPIVEPPELPEVPGMPSGTVPVEPGVDELPEPVVVPFVVGEVVPVRRCREPLRVCRPVVVVVDVSGLVVCVPRCVSVVVSVPGVVVGLVVGLVVVVWAIAAVEPQTANIPIKNVLRMMGFPSPKPQSPTPLNRRSAVVPLV
jgi:hypothetical protein